MVDTSLYVDDATLERTDLSSTILEAELTAASDSFVDTLEKDLQLEVSTSKSVVVASTPSSARRMAAASATGAYRPREHAKLLGVDSGGGRRRRVSVLKTRLKHFKRMVPRFQRLRRAGVDVRHVAATVAPPRLTNGAQTCGIADTHLHQLRVNTAAAHAAATSGKQVDAVLYLADGGTAAPADPTYAAHVLPIVTWATALWQRWVPAAQMIRAADRAAVRVLSSGIPRWQLVSGPAGAFVATLARLGWTRRPNHVLVDDCGEEFDLLLDPPLVVRQAVRRSVRRWQVLQLAKQNAHLIPDQPDLVLPNHTGRPSQEYILDLGDNLFRLVHPRGGHVRVPSVADWASEHRPALRSAIVGGQWTQTRLFQANLATDPRCRLCEAAQGTLLHRHDCIATKPPQG